MRLLCIEDNAMQRKMIDLMLAATGMEVDFASDGREGVDAWQVNEYDAVLMDMEMPVLSGLKAAREIRQMEGGLHLGYTPILFISGNENADQVDLGYEAGGDGHLCKPFTSTSLINALDSLMRAVKRRGVEDLRQAL